MAVVKVIVFALLLFLPTSAFSKLECEDGYEALASDKNGSSTFLQADFAGDKARYARSYDDLLINLPWHQDVRKQHERFQPRSGNIFEAGAGSLIISNQVQDGSPQRIVRGFDISPDMLGHARRKNFRQDRIHVSDVADLRINGVKVPDGVARGIINNNVIYILDRDHADAAIAEWARVTQDGGILTFASPRPMTNQRMKFFLSQLDKQWSHQVRQGNINDFDRTAGLDANDRLGSSLVTVMRNKEVIERLRKHGFETIYSGSAYDGILFFVVAKRVPRRVQEPSLRLFMHDGRSQQITYGNNGNGSLIRPSKSLWTPTGSR